jgi:hypothetical protein
MLLESFRLAVGRFWGFDEAEGGETLAQTEPANSQSKTSRIPKTCKIKARLKNRLVPVLSPDPLSLSSPGS